MRPDKNYFVCNRSIFKNPLWYAEKFTKGQAWVDLFGNANHSDGYFEKNSQRVDIKRGQTGRSIETLAKDWRWSRNKVKRFLKRLKDEHMIEHETNHLTSVITICNYDKYQFIKKDSELPNEPSDEPSDEPSLEPQTKKKEERRKKKEINNIHFEKLFTDYPNTKGSKSQTLKNYNSSKKKYKLTDEQIYTACMNSVQKQKDSGNEDFIYQLSNVLGQKYGDDLPGLLVYETKTSESEEFLKKFNDTLNQEFTQEDLDVVF
jgi:hypothetical protein